ncbi:hypothetical protein ACRAWF_34580 [Streptomyces sp. L7]
MRTWANARRRRLAPAADRCPGLQGGISRCSTPWTRWWPRPRALLPERGRQAGEKVIAQRPYARDFEKVSALVEEALEAPARRGPRPRAARGPQEGQADPVRGGGGEPALGAPARGLAKSMKSLTSLLGEHQDSVMVRETLRELSAVAHAAGESSRSRTRRAVRAGGAAGGGRGGRAAWDVGGDRVRGAHG